MARFKQKIKASRTILKNTKNGVMQWKKTQGSIFLFEQKKQVRTPDKKGTGYSVKNMLDYVLRLIPISLANTQKVYLQIIDAKGNEVQTFEPNRYTRKVYKHLTADNSPKDMDIVLRNFFSDFN